MIRHALVVVGVALTMSVAACTPVDARQPLVLAGVGMPTHIASDLSHVYVATRQAESSVITRVDKDTWQPEMVAKVVQPIKQLELSNAQVYWLVEHQPGDQPVVAIQKAEREANAKVEDLIKTQETITSFAFDATHLYWSQASDPNHEDESRSQGILRVMDPSSTPTNIVTRMKGEPHGITLGAGHVYWVTKESDGGSAVMSWPKLGGDARELLVFHRTEVQGRLPALAAADDGVYVLTCRELLKLGSDGQTSQRVKHGFTAPVPDLAFDFKNLYFRTMSGLMRMNLKSEEFLPLGPTGEGRFAVDSTYLFWIEGDKVLKHDKS